MKDAIRALSLMLLVVGALSGERNVKLMLVLAAIGLVGFLAVSFHDHIERVREENEKYRDLRHLTHRRFD